MVTVHARDLSKARGWEHILLFKEAKSSFLYSVRGNQGDICKISIEIEGFSVYANLLLSHLIESGVKPKGNISDIYWIYPQKLKVTYKGYLTERSVFDSPTEYMDEKITKNWSYSNSFSMPLPDENMNYNEIESWRAQIRKIEKERGCGVLIVVRDYRPVGGKVEIAPYFFVLTKGSSRIIRKGYSKLTGRKIDVDQSLTQRFSFTFRGNSSISGHRLRVNEYGYYGSMSVFYTNNFSIERFACAKDGSDVYITHYYQAKSKIPYTKVLSDKEHMVSWSYSLMLGKPVKAKIEMCPKDWRPRGGDESNIVSIRAYIEEKEEGIFRFILFEVSKEKGVAMNKGSEEGFDYEFENSQAGFRKAIKRNDGWEIETEDKRREAVVTIKSKDYGAWAKLKAQVQIAGNWYDCRTHDGKTYITIPYDEDEDHIADFWEKKFDVYREGAKADNDMKPEDVGNPREPGDGYSNYEEYRGFFVNGIWTDTDPTYKDIFVYDELGFGVGYFTELGLSIHLINQNEFDEDRFVNFNRGYGTLETQDGQKGLYLRGGFVEGALGFAEGIGCPNVVGPITVDSLLIWRDAFYEVMGKSLEMYEWKEIDTKDISKAKGTVVKSGDNIYEVTIKEAPVEGNIAVEKTFFKILNQTIAHELGHGVNLPHHGQEFRILENDPELKRYLESYESDDIELTYYQGATAISGGLWSGDVRCVMRYAPPINYLGWDKKIYLYPKDEGEDSLTTYCSSKEGTGINALPKRRENGKPYPVSGDATKGGCKKRVDLKGIHYGGE